MIWVVIAMGLFTEMPIRQVFKAARKLRKGEESPARSSLCMARQRLGSEPLVELHRLVVKPMATEQTPGAFYRGMRKVAIDGVVLDAPDCEAHQHLGRSSGSRGEGPFPQVRKVSLVELGTHIEFAFVYGGWKDSEKKLVKQLWDSIPEGSLLIEDRGFFSYESWKELHEKHKLLVRVTNSMVLKPIKYLSDGSYLAKIYPNSWSRSNDRHGITVRIIEYKLDDPQRTGPGTKPAALARRLAFVGGGCFADQIGSSGNSRRRPIALSDGRQRHIASRRIRRLARCAEQSDRGANARRQTVWRGLS